MVDGGDGPGSRLKIRRALVGEFMGEVGSPRLPNDRSERTAACGLTLLRNCDCGESTGDWQTILNPARLPIPPSELPA